MSTADIDMSPDASPSGGRRVNKIPMYIFGAVLCGFLLVIGLVAIDRADKQNQTKSEKDKKTGNTSAFAREVAGEQDGGIVPPLAVPEQPDAIPVATPDLNSPPAPPTSSSSEQLQRNPRDDEIARIRQAKLEQLQNAIKAKTTVEVTAARSAKSSPSARHDEVLEKMAAVRQQIEAANAENSHTDSTTAYKERLKAIRAVQGETGEGKSGSTPNNNYDQFAGDPEKGDRWKLDSKIEAPRSPYEIRAGFVLPATLISGINSELPGQIMAQVSQDVSDTATGKWRLIPQGSRLVGWYSSEVAYGQSRVLIAWQRIIFPDGKAIDIGAMPGADSAGYAGFTDQVNNHLMRLYGSAILMSAVTAGFAISQPQSVATVGTTTTQNTSSALSQALGQQLGQVTSQMIAKNMSTSPTLEIRPGYRFNVIVTKDLTFSKPYQAFDY